MGMPVRYQPCKPQPFDARVLRFARPFGCCLVFPTAPCSDEVAAGRPTCTGLGYLMQFQAGQIFEQTAVSPLSTPSRYFGP